MQINVHRGSSPQLFTAMLFPEATPETTQWLQDQWQRGTNMLTDIGRQYAKRAEDTWKQLYDPSLMSRARSMMRKVGGMFHPNSIISLETLEAVQTAKPVMQRYIMAMPELRKRYHKQRCDGYSESYFDYEPGLVGEAHYDWRRVNNGMVNFTTNEEGEEVNWVASMYPDDLREGDAELEFDQQVSILDSAWRVAYAAILKRMDPTDVFNGKLED